MFRIYADANGEPADYSPSNVPLKTPKFLPISLKGVEENDYAMVMGFPGSTSRYLTQSEVKMRMEAINQAMIDMRTIYLDVLREWMAQSDKIRIQYASKFAGSSNYWKNSIGMNKAIIDNDVLGTKAEIERRYAEWAKGKPEYEGVVEKIDAVVAEQKEARRQSMYLVEALLSPIKLCSHEAGQTLLKALQEKNDSLLEAGKKALQKEFDRIHNKDYDHEVERAVAKAMLPAVTQYVDAANLPAFYQTIEKKYKGDYNAYVDYWFNNSVLATRENLRGKIPSGFCRTPPSGCSGMITGRRISGNGGVLRSIPQGRSRRCVSSAGRMPVSIALSSTISTASSVRPVTTPGARV